MAKVIGLDQRVSTPRGRKANIDPKLVKLLTVEKLPVDRVLVLDESDGFPATTSPGKERSAQRNRIATHWAAAERTEPLSVVFSRDGQPQVSVNHNKLAKGDES